MSEKSPVAPMDPSKRNSPVTGPIDEESTVLLDGSQPPCFWNDREYQEGTFVCSEGAAYECSFGKWVRQTDGC